MKRTTTLAALAKASAASFAATAIRAGHRLRLKRSMHINSRPARLFGLAATIAALALPAIVASPIASAKDQSVDGVRAEIKRGTLEVNGDDQANAVALRLKAGDSTVVQVDVGDNGSADFSFARGDVDTIDVKTGGGNDSARVDDANGAFTNTIPTTIAGGDGNDSLQGGQVQAAAENEKFIGGDGNDSVDGGKGNDTASLGGGNDTFRWDNGEGSDVIEGQDGSDTMVFNGAVNENVTLTANGGRLTFFRTQGNVTMDTDGVETVDFNALGGTDNVTVNDLSGTDVRKTNIDLAGTLGGSAGDTADDNVVVNGTNGVDNINITGNGSGADVTGLATAVSVKHAETTDSLAVNTRGGTDNVLTSGIAGVLKVLVDGVAV
jgi:Ca2+-binding RTX toxin-like protein